MSTREIEIESKREWLRQAAARYGASLFALVSAAGVSYGNVHRFMNDDPPDSVLRTKTLTKIAATAGIEPWHEWNAKRDLVDDMAELIGDCSSAIPGCETACTMAAAIQAQHPDAKLWRMHGHALDGEGIRAGDFMVVDPSAKPTPGQLVIAQIYDWASGSPRTVCRIYEPPFLLAASSDPGLRKPVTLDQGGTIEAAVISHFRLFTPASTSQHATESDQHHASA